MYKVLLRNFGTLQMLNVHVYTCISFYQAMKVSSSVSEAQSSAAQQLGVEVSVDSCHTIVHVIQSV